MVRFGARGRTYSPARVVLSSAQTRLRGRSAAVWTVVTRLRRAVKERERVSARMFAIGRVDLMEMRKTGWRDTLLVCWLTDRTLSSAWLEFLEARQAELAVGVKVYEEVKNVKRMRNRDFVHHFQTSHKDGTTAAEADCRPGLNNYAEVIRC